MTTVIKEQRVLGYAHGTSDKLWAGFLLYDDKADLWQFVSAWGRRGATMIQHKRQVGTVGKWNAQHAYDLAVSRKLNDGYEDDGLTSAFIPLAQTLMTTPLGVAQSDPKPTVVEKIIEPAPPDCVFCKQLATYYKTASPNRPPDCTCGHGLLDNHMARSTGGPPTVKYVDHNHACLRCACANYALPVATCDFCRWAKNFEADRAKYLHELCSCGHGAHDGHTVDHEGGHNCVRCGCPTYQRWPPASNPLGVQPARKEEPPSPARSARSIRHLIPEL